MAKTYKQLMEEARQAIPEVTIDEVKNRLERGENWTLLDVREREEYREGHLDGAISLPRGFLEIRVEEAVPDKSTPIIAYCAGGVRSLIAARTLKEMGYENVVSMAGGYTAWKNAGNRWVADRQFTPEQITRYARHFTLPEVGEKGQAKLLDAKVLCIGAGGLGSPVAYYLAAAGVGTIGIIDHDVVDMSNLQRQILHTNDRVGMPKVESAQKTLNALNPDVKVIGFNERLSSENVMRIIKDFDVIVNGCDNFPTRYLINDACVMAKKPLVDGSIFQFEGQATVFYPGRGPCYRCLFPEPPPPGAAPSCAEAGVLGVLPGLVGCVQALEAMKLILGAGRPLIGRMMHFDTLSSEVRVLKLRRDPNCLVCSDHPKITELIDYEEFCGLRTANAA
ncbi:MAG TPA: molybdopterin-synthase adenylyltransferase MoeB [Methylomirabilota bacterium]|jgi:adenylyltransferase/sulfurtransferase|nr:molybdopterin-synthase adenylyltransferase MoeB [Methylomirabilota bacterium]